MARSPIGHVEVFDRLYVGDEEISANWQRLIWAQPLMEWGGWEEKTSGCYPFAFLFGVAAVGCDDLRGIEPIAADRGLPPDLSQELRWDVLDQDEENHSHIFVDNLTADAPLHTDYYGHTWVTWSEMQQMDRKRVIAPGWSTLLTIMEVLALKYGDDGVRLVFWFSK